MVDDLTILRTFCRVGLHIASLAHLLPPSIASTMDEKSQRVTIADKIARRRHDDEAQIRDAEERVVLWDAEERADNLSDMADSSEADGEGEEDPSLVAEQSDEWREQNKRSERVGLARDKKGMPLGLRLQDGRIIPVPPTALQEAKRRRAAREQGEDVDGEDVEDVEMFVAKGVRREWNENTNADLKQNVRKSSRKQT